MTIYHDNYNFGAVLQAYALQRILTDMGAEASVLDIRFKQNTGACGKRRGALSRIRNKVLRTIQKRFYAGKIQRLKDRCRKYQSFKEHWIRTTDTVEEDDLRNIGDEFDLYIAGSDQIWNPDYWKGAYFLDFVHEIGRKASYSASIGVSSYNRSQKEYVYEQLKSFSRISVRETDARAILKGLGLEQEIEVVLDPTFLLGPAEWDRLCHKTALPDQYVLCCLLGTGREHRSFAVKLARAEKLKLVMLTTGYQEMLLNSRTGDLELIDVDPGEVLWAIKNARVVLTDSFHIMALSVNYGKQFYVLRRDQDTQQHNMNSRIYSFLKETGLEARLIDSDIVPDLEAIDYRQVEKLLLKRKEESLKFLQSVIALRQPEGSGGSN